MRRSLLITYIGVTALANIITATTTPAEIGPFLITWGTWFIGATFILRDGVQLAYGRAMAYAAIGVALLVTVALSLFYGDLLAITVASALAFGIGESLDTEIFSRAPWGLPARVAVSGIVGGLLDTTVFVLVGLSPWWTSIITWEQVPNAILGVWLVKTLLQVAAAGVLQTRRVVA